MPSRTKMSLGFLSAIITSALFIAAAIFKDNISVSVVGLCLTYMMPLPDIFKELLLSSTDLETQ